MLNRTGKVQTRNKGIDPCYWWLRSRGHNHNFDIDPTYVDESGTIRDVMPWDNDDKKGVRPALWINLND